MRARSCSFPGAAAVSVAWRKLAPCRFRRSPSAGRGPRHRGRPPANRGPWPRSRFLTIASSSALVFMRRPPRATSSPSSCRRGRPLRLAALQQFQGAGSDENFRISLIWDTLRPDDLTRPHCAPPLPRALFGIGPHVRLRISVFGLINDMAGQEREASLDDVRACEQHLQQWPLAEKINPIVAGGRAPSAACGIGWETRRTCRRRRKRALSGAAPATRQ